MTIYYIDNKAALLQSANKIPDGAIEIKHWRTISAVQIAEVYSKLQGKSILEVEPKPKQKESKK